MGEPDRLKREIEEILGKIENFPGPEARRARRPKPLARPVTDAVARRQKRIAREMSRISVSQVMLFAFLLILGSFFFRGVGIALWALYAGVVLFLVSFGIMMFGGRGRTSRAKDTVWRGRNVSYGTYARAPQRRSMTGNPMATSLLVRLRRWWTQRNHHPRL